MRERVEGLIGDAARGMWISTFHSACVRILRREAEQFGYTKSFTIYDSGDSRALLKRLVKEHEADAYGLTPASVQSRISKLKNELSDAESYARQANMSDPAERVFVEVFADYQRQLQKANAFDFDDLIGQTCTCSGRSAGRRHLPPPFPPHPGRRVPGHQPRPVLADPRAHAPRVGGCGFRPRSICLQRHDDLRARSGANGGCR